MESKMRTIAITDAEARLAAQGKLGAILRVAPDAPSDKHRIVRFESPASLKGRYGWKAEGEPMMPPYFKCPLGAPGQRLGLKETWMPEAEQGCPTGGCLYKATDAPEPDGDRPLIWRSPVTMPAWAIRHWPTVQEVRAVQVCRMQPEDAIALGFSTKLREHDAVCHLREQVAEHYHLTPETWVWFARLEG